MTPTVKSFFDPNTFSYSYVVWDPQTQCAAIIDSVFDYQPASGSLSTYSADLILDYVKRQQLSVEWILETHVHADHLSAARYLKSQIGGRIAIGNQIHCVQRMFGKIFNAEPQFAVDGSQFDRLFADEDQFKIGSLCVQVLHTPGHTPACVTYVIGDIAFVGDTLFMPDYGTARADFPGGNARFLYRSIQRIFALPATTTLYLCHDYGTASRPEFCGQTTVADEIRSNIQIHEGISEPEFVEFRQTRDATLNAPKLLYPAVQFNMRGSALPPPEQNGQSYFKIPVEQK